ncbi:MAG: hypothetical protein WAL84_15085, partial [Candidatus Dormiibacterota bacterium]
MAVPAPYRSDLQSRHGGADRAARSREHEVVGRGDRHPREAGVISPEALLTAALALFNESEDLDATLGKTLTMLTTACDGRIGEIWLRGGDRRDVELRYSWSDGAADVLAFEADARALGLGKGPGLVSRVVKSGRGSAVVSVIAGGRGGRAAGPAATDIHTAVTFPIRGKRTILGVLVVFRVSTVRSHSSALAAMPAICRHLGRFIERARAENAIRESAAELTTLASTDALTGLKN